MRFTTAITLVSAMFLFPAAGADWPQWRGPNGTGVAPDADPVERFNLETGENIRWATDMPGPSSGTPAVVGDYVFTPAFNTESGQLQALGLDRATGEVLWAHDVARGRDSRERSRENYLAECSPAADDQRVYFLFGTGDLVCYTHAGEKLWEQNLSEKYGDIAIQWGYSSSPLLMDGKLYVNAFRRQPESLLLCLDPATGEQVFKVERRNDARAESREAYTSPIAATIDGQKQVVVYGGDALTGHDPATGEELWRFTEELNPRNAPNFRVISGPTQGPDGTIYVASPRGDLTIAVRVKDNTPSIAWLKDNERASTDVPCPAATEDAVFIFSGGRKRLSKLDLDGNVLWSGELDTPGYFRCSPIVAGGKVYLINAEGEMFVVSAGDEFQVLSHTSLGGYPTRASVSVAGDDLFIRTGDKLICAGK